MNFEKQSTLNSLKMRYLFVLFLGISVNALFWREGLGVNLFIFNILSLGSVVLVNLDQPWDHWRIAAILGMISSSGAVVLVNSSLSVVVCVLATLSFFSMFIHRELCSFNFSLPAAATLLPSGIESAIKQLELLPKSSRTRRALKHWKILLIPGGLLVVFISLYASANSKFELHVANFFSSFEHIFQWIAENVSLEWLLLLTFGCAYAVMILFGKPWKFIESQIKTVVAPREYEEEPTRHSRKVALISLISLNLLLALVNYIDIDWVWFNFNYDEIHNLSEFVHEGTYVLIFAILVSMAVILYFFRSDLNFFKPRWLRILGWIWIAQNAILAISVAMRNYHYIVANHAITYKRIGVFIFLLLVIFGLATLVAKVRFRWSPYRIIRANALIMFVVFNAFAWVNWDEAIVTYNLNNPAKENIEYEYLLGLSDKVLDNLVPYRDQMNYQQLNSWYFRQKYDSMQDALSERILAFREGQDSRTWLSWNYADHKLNQSLNHE